MDELHKEKVLIEWLSVLSNGYVKPDVNKTSGNNTGVVRDTKKFFPYIDEINDELCTRLQVKQPVKIKDEY